MGIENVSEVINKVSKIEKAAEEIVEKTTEKVNLKGTKKAARKIAEKVKKSIGVDSLNGIKKIAQDSKDIAGNFLNQTKETLENAEREIQSSTQNMKDQVATKLEEGKNANEEARDSSKEKIRITSGGITLNEELKNAADMPGIKSITESDLNKVNENIYNK